MKTLCALIGAFFLVAGIAVLVAGPPGNSPRTTQRARASRPAHVTGHPPLLWEADVDRSGARTSAAKAVSGNR
ncbi:MAG TPA: hypothetical protein VKH46_10770 [Thermoanaerobaculia bacterium]|nr:hypothetical protein [Thermoanaerobaculia bacterium]